MQKKITQNAAYWDTDESIVRYAKMKLELSDAEAALIMRATQELHKPVSEITILDLGCGGGRTTIPLHKMGYKITGVDIAPNLIKALKKKAPKVNAVVGDVSMLDFKNSSFDIVLFSHNSWDCMYPEKIRTKTLVEINRVLKPGGFYVFSSHVFNLIPFDVSVLKNIIRNIPKIPKLIGSGAYYQEKMGNGDIVDLYAASFSSVADELRKQKMEIVSHTRVIFYFENLFVTWLRAFVNWERYYLARKKV